MSLELTFRTGEGVTDKCSFCSTTAEEVSSVGTKAALWMQIFHGTLGPSVKNPRSSLPCFTGADCRLPYCWQVTNSQASEKVQAGLCVRPITLKQTCFCWKEAKREKSYYNGGRNWAGRDKDYKVDVGMVLQGYNGVNMKASKTKKKVRVKYDQGWKLRSTRERF